jgi:uncharacterized protein (DUF1330 family)
MLILVQIDLSEADLALFEDYEAQALKLLAASGARLLMRVRSLDDRAETHLLQFDDEDAFQSFLNHPDRAKLQPQWDACKATSQVTKVREVD